MTIVRPIRWSLLSALFSISLATPASAHASERGFVLLLPTGYYLAGGALAVALTFVLVALAPQGMAEALRKARLRLVALPEANPVPWSIASFIFLAWLIWQGFRGNPDPLANPLPLTVWTLWWIGFTFLVALLGDLWRFLNPWTGLYRLLRPSRRPFLLYPAWLAHWPAVLLFFAFAWFELVDPAPDNPERLARAVAIYWAMTFAGVLLFGEEAWLGKAEPFSLFFRLVALLSPIRRGSKGRFEFVFPGTALVKSEPLGVSGIFFVLLVLAAVSFDGLSKTFFWLGLGGINPLEFPGRSAVIGRNTLGLVIMWALLAGVYTSALWLGWVLGAREADPRRLAGGLVLSLMPIALAYHFAHYLTTLLVNGQYAIAAFLPVDIHVTTSFLTTYDGARLIWNLQAAAIVLGHLLAVMLAHLIALDCFGRNASARRAELPIAAVMVLYTLFGLWLLSTPVAA